MAIILYVLGAHWIIVDDLKRREQGVAEIKQEALTIINSTSRPVFCSAEPEIDFERAAIVNTGGTLTVSDAVWRCRPRDD